jgi:hypothetical protein
MINFFDPPPPVEFFVIIGKGDGEALFEGIPDCPVIFYFLQAPQERTRERSLNGFPYLGGGVTIEE